MIKGKKYQFVHMPKCAGTFIRTMLKKYFGGIQAEAPFNQKALNSILEKGVYFPEGFRFISKAHKPPDLNSYKELNLGCIRHPYTWYLSLYSYNCRGLGIGGASDNFEKFFPEESFVLKEESPENFQKWIKTLDKNRKTKRLMTSHFRKLYRKPRFWTFIKMENLYQDLFLALESIGLLTEDKKKSILKEKKINTTPSKIWKDFHDDETLHLIKKNNLTIFEKFYRNDIL
jgi:hypothetical protein